MRKRKEIDTKSGSLLEDSNIRECNSIDTDSGISKLSENSGIYQRDMTPLRQRGHDRIGVSALGMIAGKRSKIEKEFLEDLHDCWQRTGKKAMLRAFEEKPAEMVCMVARLLPKRAEISVDTTMTLPEDQRKKIAEAWLMGRDLKDIEGEVVSTVSAITETEKPNEELDSPPKKVEAQLVKRRLVKPTRTAHMITEEDD